MEHPDTLTLPDLAALMRISVRHARRLVRNGDLPPPLRLGRCQRWPRPLIDAWLANASQTLTTNTKEVK